MIDWSQLWLLECIFIRMTGFILFNPLLGRSNLPGLVKAGFILVLTMAVYGTGPELTVSVPEHYLEFAVILLLELAVGFALGFIMRLFFSVVQTGGSVIDTQMGLTMAQIYDAGSQSNLSVTGSLLNILMVLIFFAANGHYTLLRILTLSGELLPYGTAALGQEVASYAAEVFISCMLLSIKLALPILAAELLGELGMGILMKAIPQINAFVINMELKVIIGLGLLFFFLTPINEFLLSIEQEMLQELERMLQHLAAGA